MADMLKNVYEKYKRSVRENPDTVGQIETTFRLLSYLIAGRLRSAQVLSELLYTSSNLLVFLNDAILKQSVKLVPKVPVSQEKLSLMLTVMEYVEVFIEVASLQLFGEVGKWIIIATIQICKAALRYFILSTFKTGLQPNPPIAPLDRSVISRRKPELEEKVPEADVEVKPEVSSMTFTLKRSGKVMRKISAVSAAGFRKWASPEQVNEVNVGTKRRDQPSTTLSRQRVWAETIHIVKPLVHLASLYACGLNSWKPWLLSCGLDVTSLSMMGDPIDLNDNEKGELRRRTFMLLFYLLRSPFYDRYSQAKIILLMKVLADNIPGTSLLIKPLLAYLPAWQKVYFYVWSV